MKYFDFEKCTREDLYSQDLFLQLRKITQMLFKEDHPDAGQKETQSSQDKAVEFQTPSET